MATLDEVKQIIGNVLQIGTRVEDFDRTTHLLGSVPEFDSMAVVTLITTIEENYGIIIEDDEINAEVFETVGAFHDFVIQKISG